MSRFVLSNRQRLWLEKMWLARNGGERVLFYAQRIEGRDALPLLACTELANLGLALVLGRGQWRTEYVLSEAGFQVASQLFPAPAGRGRGLTGIP